MQLDLSGTYRNVLVERTNLLPKHQVRTEEGRRILLLCTLPLPRWTFTF